MTKQAFEMPNRLEAVSDMVLCLKAELGDALEFDAMMRLEICVTEALSNLAIHADTRKRDAPVVIKMSIEETSVAIEIFDPVGTMPFDPQLHAIPLEDVEPTAESGRGLGLILECADSVTYGSFQNRNRLSLFFENRTSAE